MWEGAARMSACDLQDAVGVQVSEDHVYPRGGLWNPDGIAGKTSGFHTCFQGLVAYLVSMIQTVEAIVDEKGDVRLLEQVHLDRRHRALVTILSDDPSESPETTLLSEAALARDWNRSEEEEAWSHLQQAR
jgi:hypothetical protein